MKQSKPLTIVGWVITIGVAGMLAMSAIVKFVQPESAVEMFEHLGFTSDQMKMIGALELACVLVYLMPWTAPIGAILITGYLGGAIATHVNVEDNADIVMPIILAVAAWIALFLRDARVRGLVSWRRAPARPAPSSN